MTTRKPPSMSVPDWIERQIKTAEAEGAFENLPGAGKPIPGLGTQQHELAWVADYLRREDVDVAGLLPPGLALAKEVEVLPVRLMKERSETRVRAVVEGLNRRITRAHLAPQVGPPLRVHTVDVDEVVEQWRADRTELADRLAAARARSVPPPPVPRRRWWRRAPAVDESST